MKARRMDVPLASTRSLGSVVTFTFFAFIAKPVRERCGFRRRCSLYSDGCGSRIGSSRRFQPHEPCSRSLECDVSKAYDFLWTKCRIITAAIKRTDYQGLRVTPNIYTTLEEVDTFAAAVENLLKNPPSMAA